MTTVEKQGARSYDRVLGSITPEKLKQLFPRCVWIIPDGNRRLAREKNLSPEEGHKLGSQIVISLARAAEDFGIDELTFWAFSQDNQKRSRREVDFLMEKLLPSFIDENIDEIDQREARLCFVGDRENLGEQYPSLIKQIEEAEARTVANTRFRINVFLNYDGAWHIAEAVNRLKDSGVTRIDKHILFTEMSKDIAPPDLLIRTSNERRLSGIESPLTKNAELIFSPELFPDYNPGLFLRDLIEYTRREQRCGR
jgi:undecaprenyl diphosphate synthase